MSKSRRLENILQSNYIKNDVTTFDFYLGDIYEGSEWRSKLEERFITELERYDGKLSEENIRKLARHALKYINRKLREAIDHANKIAVNKGQDPTYRRMASNNELVAKKISDNVQQKLHDLNLDLIKNIAKQLGITVSQKNKENICYDISNKLTKPVKVTKQLHRGKWDSNSHDEIDSKNYEHLIKQYYSDDTRKLASSYYTILKICRNIEDTLCTDLDDNTILNMAKQLNVIDYDDRSTNDLCQSITRKCCSVD